MKHIIIAARMLLVLTILTGVLYPLAVTLAGGVLFPVQANGSLITRDGVVIGSSLIGQSWTDERYFWSRPSAVGYMETEDGTLASSGATNLSITSETLAAQVAERASVFRAVHGMDAAAPVPPDMLFASASGLDPHISPDSAALQVARVAAARGIDPVQVAALVEAHTESPLMGFLGTSRVNVLALNLALDGVE